MKTITLTGTFDVATVNGYFTGILGSEVDFEFYPIGTTGGNPKASGKAILTSYDRTPDISRSCRIQLLFKLQTTLLRELLRI